MTEEGEWGDVELETGRSRSFRFGPVTLHVRRTRDEIWVAKAPSVESEADEPGSLAGEDRGDRLEWSRWAPRTPLDGLRLVPVLPDRFVVVAPEVPFSLVPGARARIYVRIPLRISVRLADDEDGPPLLEVPSMVMSDTWWGDFASGELGYWLTTKARRGVTDDLFLPHLVLCPVDLSNGSSEMLEVEKLAVRTVHLSIYRDGARLWADETSARYESEEVGSHIEISGRAPPEAPDARLVRGPREKLARGFKARTFRRLKDISGL